MNLNPSCVKCMYDRQAAKTDNAAYLEEIKNILDNRDENACSAEMNFAFNQAYAKHIGPLHSFKEINKKFNDLVLSMEKGLESEIENSTDPLATALVMARIGNYIDFGVIQNVEEKTFLELFQDTEMREDEKETYESFCKQCAEGKNFLLLTDNCGEIVLDKLFLRQLKKRFPHLNITVMVRGGEVSNDATMEDAKYVGLTDEFKVITNGKLVAGTVYKWLPEESKNAIDSADVILSKGQANFESFAGEGFHAFFTFLCKCDLFVNRFNVPRLTGMFVEE
ncbi:hypothetical protein SAMN04487831_1162 [Pseudobutyrivibrio sp. UC1225]|uniref:damage-control phosphatase ARMT1 family protein n=1 Tax=Pseudobutyrivibrio sp. UC1225 TaxID=1798185 RepID=UPI0008F23EB0|nr:ARMT1-like domain-containing protein [Pseudobutyrivibrio sp. UC1225]SFO27980.1 hypothetical protein SAMN04487831_1162 [Pseudobutyrivibrio sp. UC1225]